MFLLAAEFRIDAFFSVAVHLLHRVEEVLGRYADLLREFLDGVGLKGPAALHTDFPGLRQRLKRYAGQHDGVKGQHGALVDHPIHLFLIEDGVGHAARARHGVVDIHEHRAAGFVEEAAACVIDPEPRLRQGAAALFEFIGAGELIDRGIVG